MRLLTPQILLNSHRIPSSPALPSPPVLFLHGLLGSATNFRTIQAAIASSGRDTFALDLRNHGASPHSPAPSSLRLLAEDVAATLVAQSGLVTRCDVVGHSLGGKVAMALALSHPGLVRRLIVVDIAPVAYDAASNPGWASVQAVVAGASALQPSGFSTRREVEAALAASVPDPGVRSFVAQNLIPQQGGGFRWRVGWPGILASLPIYAGWDAALGAEGGGAVEAAHFIRGALSRYVLPHHEPTIRAHFPRAQVHTVEGAGHWVHADKPKEFLELLKALLG